MQRRCFTMDNNLIILEMNMFRNQSEKLKRNAKTAGLTCSELLRRICKDEPVKPISGVEYTEYIKTLSELMIHLHALQRKIEKGPIEYQYPADFLESVTEDIKEHIFNCIAEL